MEEKKEGYCDEQMKAQEKAHREHQAPSTIDGIIAGAKGEKPSKS